jgi:hypothetical protein
LERADLLSASQCNSQRKGTSGILPYLPKGCLCVQIRRHIPLKASKVKEPQRRSLSRRLPVPPPIRDCDPRRRRYVAGVPLRVRIVARPVAAHRRPHAHFCVIHQGRLPRMNRHSVPAHARGKSCKLWGGRSRIHTSMRKRNKSNAMKPVCQPYHVCLPAAQMLSQSQLGGVAQSL